MWRRRKDLGIRVSFAPGLLIVHDDLSGEQAKAIAEWLARLRAPADGTHGWHNGSVHGERHYTVFF